MILLQHDGAPTGTPAPQPAVPQQPLAAPPVPPATPPPTTQAPPPAVTTPPAPDHPPRVQATPQGGEPPISADTPLIFNNPDGSEVTKTVAELIEDSNKLGGLGDPDKLVMMQKAMAGDNAAIQQFLQGYLAEQQQAAEPQQPLHTSTLDPETAARLERMESELGQHRGYVAQQERQQREGWVQQALQTEDIAKHVPLASKHPQSVARIMEHLDVARMVLQQQGVEANTPNHQQAMQKALYGAFMEVERKLKADQDYFAGLTANPQPQAAQVPQQGADGVMIPPTPAGSAPLTQNQTPRGSQTTKQSMRERLGAQVRASQMQ